MQPNRSRSPAMDNNQTARTNPLHARPPSHSPTRAYPGLTPLELMYPPPQRAAPPPPPKSHPVHRRGAIHHQAPPGGNQSTESQNHSIVTTTAHTNEKENQARQKERELTAESPTHVLINSQPQNYQSDRTQVFSVSPGAYHDASRNEHQRAPNGDVNFNRMLRRRHNSLGTDSQASSLTPPLPSLSAGDDTDTSILPEDSPPLIHRPRRDKGVPDLVQVSNFAEAFNHKVCDMQHCTRLLFRFSLKACKIQNAYKFKKKSFIATVM